MSKKLSPIIFLFAIFLFALFLFLNANALSIEETSQKSKTLKFFIFQEQAVLLNGNSTTTPFSVFISESNPVIKDAYIEIRGEMSAGSGQVAVDINQSDSFPTSRQQSFQIDSTGKPNSFRLLYGGSATASTTPYFAGIITSPGTYNFYLKTSVSGADFSLMQARLVITYEFTPPSSGGGTYPAVGYITSPVFDTGTVNGAAYNWIMWKGSKPVGTKVKLQIGTSDIPDSGSFTFRGGATCADTDYYEPSNNIQQEIKCYSFYNNKRYFRYKVRLESNPPDYDKTPQVDDIIVNWSP